MRGKSKFMRIGSVGGRCFVSLPLDFMIKQGYSPKDTVNGELQVSGEQFSKILSEWYKEKI